MTKFNVGDEVFILDQHNFQPHTGQFAGVARVTALLPKNVKVSLNGTDVRVSPSLLAHVADFPDRASQRATAVPLPTITVLDVAKIVRVTVPAGARVSKWTYPASTLFVVLGVRDRVKVAKLGGEGGRYWNLPAEWLTVVELAELNIAQ